jgi:hypothetical protein
LSGSDLPRLLALEPLSEHGQEVFEPAGLVLAVVLPPVVQKLKEGYILELPHWEVNLHRYFGLALGEYLLSDLDRILPGAFADNLSELVLEPDV